MPKTLPRNGIFRRHAISAKAGEPGSIVMVVKPGAKCCVPAQLDYFDKIPILTYVCVPGFTKLFGDLTWIPLCSWLLRPASAWSSASISSLFVPARRKKSRNNRSKMKHGTAQGTVTLRTRDFSCDHEPRLPRSQRVDSTRTRRLGSDATRDVPALRQPIQQPFLRPTSPKTPGRCARANRGASRCFARRSRFHERRHGSQQSRPF